MTTEPLIRVDDVTKHFPVTRGVLFARPAGAVKAVDGVSFTIGREETVALVGESGCGKTTTARLLLRLEKPTTGRVLLDGQDVHALAGGPLRDFRSRVQAVFQDPWSSLNPRLRVRDLVAEGMHSFGIGANQAERTERVAELLRRVQLNPEHMWRYPHEFSGGQRQRIGIARALAVEPELVICDEAVSALDVSIQAQILNLLSELQRELGLAFLFITHDLSVVRYLADEVAVMYLGQVVERAPTDRLFSSPEHPYTRGLLAAVPSIDPERRHRGPQVLGDVPSPATPPPGCRFHTRCLHATDRCRSEEPALRPFAEGEARCHFAGQLG